MTCYECGRTIDDGVELSEYCTVCEDCYLEMIAAWRAQNVIAYCPPPMELHERIAEVRREMGDQPRRDVPTAVTTRGTTAYEPKRVAYRNARKGTEARET